MSNEKDEAERRREFTRGKADGERGLPPTALVGPYMDGYVEGKDHAHHRSMTPGGMPAMLAPRPVTVPPRVIERLGIFLIDPLLVLSKPAAAWGGKSALDHVREGGTWDEVMQAFELLFTGLGGVQSGHGRRR